MAPVAYRFGPFVVDRAASRVLENGRPLDLTPKLLDLLLHLIDNAGSLVTKEALLDAQFTCVVTAIPDDARGERLVAFYTDPLVEPHELWERLCRTELPRLWLPKREDLRCVEAIPTLGTGKVDLRAVRQLAAGAAEAVAS